MAIQIYKAVVIGSGTMGSAIAAHLANSGVPVTLLDIASESKFGSIRLRRAHWCGRFRERS